MIIPSLTSVLRRFVPVLAVPISVFAAKTDIPAAAPTPPPASVTTTPVAPTPAAPAEAVSHTVENAVVKIFSTMRYPDPFRPWTKQAPADATGSGIVIEGKRILTNAHVVLYASQVQIQGNQAGDKISATVEAVAPGIDLAVLKLDDETFFDTHPPLARASALPAIKDNVLVYGYPTGGTSQSITKGIVSRIEFTSYNFPTSGLRIQIDAAINPGNSGGPALVGDKVIGLAFSHLSNAENIGYIIPCEEIEIFLKDIADGHYDGKPAMYDDCQTLENPALRAFLKLDKSVEGIVVHGTDDPDPSYPLKQWDVITKIGTEKINDQGNINLGDDLHINFRYFIQKLAKDGKVPLTVIRNGQEITLSLPVHTTRPTLISDLQGAYPSYFVYGPMVFSNATAQYMGGFGNNAGALNWLTVGGSPLIRRRTDRPATPDEQLVVVSSPFFPHKLSKGYGNPTSHVVKTINGIPIKNLAHLVEVLRDCRDEFVIIEFYEHFAETLVLPRQECVAATEDILTDNGVRSQGSPELMEIWNKKK
jgi:S1-C subfamily serine protease